jgi:hypothetical protein
MTSPFVLFRVAAHRWDRERSADPAVGEPVSCSEVRTKAAAAYAAFYGRTKGDIFLTFLYSSF